MSEPIESEKPNQNKSKYPYPHTVELFNAEWLLDIGEIIEEMNIQYWDISDELSTTEDERQFLKTLSNWLRNQANGVDKLKSQNLKQALIHTIKGEVLPVEGVSELRIYEKSKAKRGYYYPFPYRNGDDMQDRIVLEYPKTYWNNIVLLDLDPNEESFLLTFAMYTHRYAVGEAEEKQTLQEGLLKMVEEAYTKPNIPSTSTKE